VHDSNSAARRAEPLGRADGVGDVGRGGLGGAGDGPGASVRWVSVGSAGRFPVSDGAANTGGVGDGRLWSVVPGGVGVVVAVLRGPDDCPEK